MKGLHNDGHRFDKSIFLKFLSSGSRIQRATRTVADDFGTDIGSAKRVELLCSLLLRLNMTGVEEIGIPTIFGIAQTPPQEE